MLGSERDFIQEPADQEDSRLVTQNNHLVGAWLPGSFLDQRCGGVGKETKKKDYSVLGNFPRRASFSQGNVLVLLPYSQSFRAGA